MAQKVDELQSVETRKPYRKTALFTRGFILLISVLIVIIILLCVIILLLNAFKANNNNNNETDQNSINADFLKMIYRDKWRGRPALYERPQKLPVKYVIISHSAGKECFDITACSKQMVQFQSMHVGDGSPDVGFNFVIGGDSNIYVAGGWDNHNFHMHLDTIGICFIGNYIYNELSPAMIEATHNLLKIGVEKGKLDKDYILVAHNQTFHTISPGPNVYKQIKHWPHFSPEILPDIGYSKNEYK